MEGMRRALQALLNFSDHDSLDMCGRRIEVTGPIDVQAAEGNITTFENRRVVRNGQFNVIAGAAWNNGVVTSTASYNPNNPKKLTSVANIANIEVGARVSGNGVGREVYVSDKNVGAGSLTLSQPLYGAATSQSYTFTRYRYVLDFSGFAKCSRFTLEQVEFLCNGIASGILLPADGEQFHLHDVWMNRPKDRGITSHATGCQDLMLDGCQFYSNEQSVAATARTSIAFNVNQNDAKIRSSRFQRFGHTGVLYGTGHLIVGNHWFQGDDNSNAPRLGGMIFTLPNSKSVITGNYIDNCYVELNNEHDAHPEFSSEYSFGGLTLTGNIFTTIGANAAFSWIVVKPYGPGHFVHGLSVIGNCFRANSGNVDRVERVDTTFATLDPLNARAIVFQGNTFNAVNQITQNPASLVFQQNTAAKNWVLDVGPYLPFGGECKTVESVTPFGAITDAAGDQVFTMPFAAPFFGPQGDQVQLTWSEPVKGKVQVLARTDNPV
jgi:hypothetical protein